MRENNNCIVIDLPEPYKDLYLFYREPGWRMDWHRHDFCQLILIQDGVLLLHVDKLVHSLSAGQLVLIPPGLPHLLDTPLGYRQLGINLQANPDRRGVIALLDAHCSHLRVFDRLQWLASRPDLEGECRSPARLSRLKAVHQLDELLLSCLEEEPPVGTADSRFKARLLDLLDPSSGQRITLERVAREMAASPSHLERQCRREFGSSVMELYNQLRMNEACLQLSGTRLSLESIADSLGFYDPAHFSRFFKMRMKISPLQYRKQYRS